MEMASAAAKSRRRRRWWLWVGLWALLYSKRSLHLDFLL
jgi:hypothetical protein